MYKQIEISTLDLIQGNCTEKLTNLVMKDSKDILLGFVLIASVVVMLLGPHHSVKVPARTPIVTHAYYIPEVKETTVEAPRASPSVCGLDSEQLSLLKQIQAYAEPFGLKATMSAIALQESSLREGKVNKHTGALGVMQILPRTAINIARLDGIKVDRQTLLKRLKTDVQLNLEYSRKVIEYFKKVNSNKGYVNWNKVYAGYFAGHAYHKGKIYSTQIVEKIKKLKQCKLL